MFVIARAAVAPVLAEPTVRAEQVTQLVLGETAELLDRSGEYRRVRTHADHYDGWVHAGYLLEVSAEAAAAWRESAGGWSEGAVLRAGDRRIPLPLRARVRLDHDTVTLPDGTRGEVVGGSVRPLDVIRASARTVAPERWAAEWFLGSPYQWGGVTPWGVDCSGLVQTTYAARGIALPRDSSQQATAGIEIAPDNIQPGDLLFFRSESGSHISHVAFAGEDETLVHSTIACGGVVVEPWRPGSRAAGLRERLVGVRRVIA